MAGAAPVQEDLRSILMTKDDLLHCFYIFLWSKAADGLGVRGVRIPDTVILNHSRVLEYYFTSTDGSIKRKSRANLVTSHLLEQLEKHSKKCKQSGIVASILAKEPAMPTGLSTKPYTMDALRPVLVEGNVGSGTMQFFIEPKKEGAAAHNACVGVQWTPNVTYMEKRTNVHPISAPLAVASLAAKTTLEDGSTNVRTSQTISARVSAEIDRMCRAIAEHFLLVFRARILHMGLEFKVDTKEQTWLTHCFSLKLADVAAPTRVLYSLRLKEEEKGGDRRDELADSDPTANPFLSRAERLAAAHGIVLGAAAPLPSVTASGEVSLGATANSEAVRSPHLRDQQLQSSSGSVHRAGSRASNATTAASNAGRSSRAKQRFGGLRSSATAVCAVRCAVCGAQERAAPSLVARHNLLFPLSLLSFFCTNAPGTVFIDDAKAEDPQEVPDYVLMMHENEHTPCGPTARGGPRSRSAMSDGGVADEAANGIASDNEDAEGEGPGGFKEGRPPPPLPLHAYDALRRDPSWLNAQMHCCRGCTEELRGVVEDLVIDDDGKIRVPSNPSEGPGGAHRKPTRAAAVGSFARPTAAQQSRVEATHRKPPPPKAAGPSPYAADLTAEFDRSMGGGASESTSIGRRKVTGGKAGVGGSRSVSRATSNPPSPTPPPGAAVQQSHGGGGQAAAETTRPSSVAAVTLPPLAPSSGRKGSL